MRNGLPSLFAPTSTPKFTSRPPILPPEVTKPSRRHLGVSDGVLDRLMAEPMLDRPSPCRGRRWPGRSRTQGAACGLGGWCRSRLASGHMELAKVSNALRDFPMTATRIETYTARRMQSEFSSRSSSCFTFHSGVGQTTPRRRRAPQAHHQTRKQEIQRRDCQYLGIVHTTGVCQPSSLTPTMTSTVASATRTTASRALAAK